MLNANFYSLNLKNTQFFIKYTFFITNHQYMEKAKMILPFLQIYPGIVHV